MDEVRIYDCHEAYVLTTAPTAASAQPLSELAAVSLLARWLREDAQRAQLRRVVIQSLGAPLSGTATDADVLRYLSNCLAAGRLALCRHQVARGHGGHGITAGGGEAQEDEGEEPTQEEAQIKPCDFEVVVIKCKHMGTKDRKLADARFWREGGNDRHNLPAPAAGRAYSNVIEVVGYHEERDADEITITLEGGPGYTCGSEHPIIRAKGQVGKPLEEKGKTTAKFKAVCRTLPLHPLNASLFGIIGHYFFPMQMLNVYTIDIESCGRLADGSYGFGRTQQKVRVYPKDLYKLKVEIPELGKKKFERERSWSGGSRTDSVSRSAENKVSGQSTEQKSSTSVSSERIEQKDSFEYQTRQGSLSEKRSQSLDAANNYSSETEFEASDKPSGPRMKAGEIASSIELTRNGGQIEGTAKIGKYIETLLDIEKKIREVADFIKHFQPQVGWKFGWEISLFKGSLEYEWGFKEWEDHTVYEYWKFAVEMTLIELKLEASFGVDLRVLGCGITILIFGEVTGECKIGAEKESSPADPKPWELGAGASIKGEFGIRAALGADWVKAEGKLTFGWEVTAKCECSTKEPFHIDYSFDFLGAKTKLKASLKWVGSVQREWKVADKSNIKKGSFPNREALPAAA